MAETATMHSSINDTDNNYYEPKCITISKKLNLKHAFVKQCHYLTSRHPIMVCKTTDLSGVFEFTLSTVMLGLVIIVSIK